MIGSYLGDVVWGSKWELVKGVAQILKPGHPGTIYCHEKVIALKLVCLYFCHGRYIYVANIYPFNEKRPRYVIYCRRGNFSQGVIGQIT